MVTSQEARARFRKEIELFIGVPVGVGSIVPARAGSLRDEHRRGSSRVYPITLQAWLTLPSCLASSNRPILALMTFRCGEAPCDGGCA
jgi:hypothetical protein